MFNDRVTSFPSSSAHFGCGSIVSASSLDFGESCFSTSCQFLASGHLKVLVPFPVFRAKGHFEAASLQNSISDCPFAKVSSTTTNFSAHRLPAICSPFAGMRPLSTTVFTKI